MKDKLALFTKYLLDFMFYSGIAVIATLPISFKFLLLSVCNFYVIRNFCDPDYTSAS